MGNYFVRCYCGAPMTLWEGRYGPFYGCSRWPDCDGTHGCHPSGEPLGTPADATTRKARHELHKALERVFGDRRIARERWKRENTRTGHAGNLNKAECEEAISELEEDNGKVKDQQEHHICDRGQ